MLQLNSQDERRGTYHLRIEPSKFSIKFIKIKARKNDNKNGGYEFGIVAISFGSISR